MNPNINVKIEELLAQGGSSAGYSFYKSYQTCPWKFALEELLGVQTTSTKWALIQGSILHGAMECLYLGYSVEDIYTLIEEVAVKKLSTDEDRQLMIDHVKTFFDTYRGIFYSLDMEAYTDWELEKEIIIPLAHGLSMTGRVDKLYFTPETGTWNIGDYKSTKNGLSSAFKSAFAGDQFSLYTWGLKQQYPDRRFNVVIDALFGRELKYNGFTVDVGRSPAVVYTDAEIAQVVIMFSGLVMEVAQKVKSYQLEEAPLEFLFPRNGTFCGTFGCPYSEICRKKLLTDREYPGISFDREKIEGLKDFNEWKIELNKSK